MAGALPPPPPDLLRRIGLRLSELSGSTRSDAEAIMRKIRVLVATWPVAKQAYVDSHIERQEAEAEVQESREQLAAAKRGIFAAMDRGMHCDAAGQEEAVVETSAAVVRARRLIPALDARCKAAMERWEQAVWRHTMTDTRLEELSQSRAALQDQLARLTAAGQEAEQKELLAHWQALCADAIRQATAEDGAER
ncbi:hypothetical protein FNF27_01065 [Cafeteria roenbergensis]|uniref:Uncharacterized protein n=1 Tax=Cafeteria roenbergensis TaxID=33653 RepID=A0A5A8EKU2_CAFRO|nr:hypothetical protein FNF28_06671 [Cafeteria roenbergensis]KAA0156793.1 hypothetical protein FNF29_00904 [Cafeteria roenbergensis]KAA0159338.1 hypothetical protein FNF31_04925 [Cafeteria roenbergensis]KAA0177287.1 hypothetical protein FNF27_01065 [Cafeteria roenbergensis]|eukprot:KAA0156793.1 hypothetical protein FNF29_00904 [Cafeteria roenbergensis]